MVLLLTEVLGFMSKDLDNICMNIIHACVGFRYSRCEYDKTTEWIYIILWFSTLSNDVSNSQTLDRYTQIPQTHTERPKLF